MDLPPIPPGLSAESTIRRDAEGRWFHDGEPVVNEGVARAFDSWVERHEDGRYILRNAVNWLYVEIEGAPLFVRSAVPDEAGLGLFLSDGREARLDPATLRQDAEGNLYCDLSERRLTARFSRKATLQLEPLVDEDEQGILLRIGGVAVHPPEVEDPVR